METTAISSDGKRPVQGVVMAPAGITSELIRIAALLAQCHDIPSDLVDDYPQKTYSANRVARMMDRAHQTYPMLAYQLRQVSDSIHAVNAATVQFSELTHGDRVLCHGALWTKIDQSYARKHGDESIALGKRGYGYIGDSFCSFEQNISVVFVSP
jgi:hypothetical protein